MAEFCAVCPAVCICGRQVAAPYNVPFYISFFTGDQQAPPTSRFPPIPALSPLSPFLYLRFLAFFTEFG